MQTKVSTAKVSPPFADRESDAELEGLDPSILFVNSGHKKVSTTQMTPKLVNRECDAELEGLDPSVQDMILKGKATAGNTHTAHEHSSKCF